METVRLQQILSRAGVASRRRAEALISAGRVAVNGRVVTVLGTKAHPVEDVVTVDGERVGAPQERATLMLHKPDRVVTTLDDPEGRETVAQLVEAEPYRFVPVGRLDYHTEGLLLLTTDGELVNRLLHPSYHIPKVYQVRVKGKLRSAALDTLREGVKLDDGPTRPTVVEVIEEGPRHTWLELVVTEGRNRLVRRMFDAVGHPALRVLRTEMATLDLDELKPGQHRYLSAPEIAALYRTAGLSAPGLCERASEVGTALLGKARRGRGSRPGHASEAQVDAKAKAKPRDGRARRDRGQARAFTAPEPRAARDDGPRRGPSPKSAAQGRAGPPPTGPSPRSGRARSSSSGGRDGGGRPRSGPGRPRSGAPGGRTGAPRGRPRSGGPRRSR